MILINRKLIEVKIALITLFVLLVLPIITFIVFADAGLSIIGNALAQVNPATKVVEIFNPDGEKIHELELSTAWPMTGIVTDEFGTMSELRYELNLGRHRGIDIANGFGLIGDPITPFSEGRVVTVDHSDDSACGISIRLDHGHNINSVYCHLSSIVVNIDDSVEPGVIIGYSGNTGTSTGPHLHFGIEVYGVPVNPRVFLVGEPERMLPNAGAPITY